MLQKIHLTTEQKRQIYHARRVMLEGMCSYHRQLKDIAPKVDSAAAQIHMASMYQCADDSVISSKAVNRIAYFATRETALLREFNLTVMTEILDPV